VFPNLPATYRDDLKSYDPVETIKKSNVPVLVLQGERDYQVTMKDFALWQSALRGRPKATFRRYRRLNHLFASGEGKSSPTEYENTSHVSVEVIDDIAEWIQKPQ
jgi:uncharacterized protein